MWSTSSAQSNNKKERCNVLYTSRPLYEAKQNVILFIAGGEGGFHSAGMQKINNLSSRMFSKQISSSHVAIDTQ